MHTYRLGSAPRTVPLIGNALKMLRNPRQFLTSLPRHGDLVQVKVGMWRAYVVCHPELAHQVLIDDRTFDKGGPLITSFREFLGNGLGSCPHDEHRRQRRMLQPAFRPVRLPGYAAVMSNQIAELTGRWRADQVVDVLEETQQLTTAVIAKTLSTALESNEPVTRTMIDDLNALLAGTLAHMLTPAPLRRLPIRQIRSFYRARNRLQQTLAQAITDHRRGGATGGDLLSELFEARDARGRSLSDTEIRDQLMSFFMGGAETTAATVAWALYLLARHPRIERRIHAEVDAVLAGRTATFDDLPRLELTRRVVTETLRVYPVAWLTTRTTTVDTILGGHPLPASSSILISPYAIHHSDLFPDPDRFDPDRWLMNGTTDLTLGTHFPFGGGARKCIGNEFAMVEATLTVASIAALMRLQLVSGATVRPALRATLVPRDLRMRCIRREIPPPPPRQNSVGA